MPAQKLVITMADESTITVMPNLGEILAFEKYLKMNPRLGSVTDNALKAGPFRAWHAAKRLGLLHLSWDEFSTGDNAALSVDGEDKADAEDDFTD